MDFCPVEISETTKVRGFHAIAPSFCLLILPDARILTIYLLPGKQQQWLAILDLSGSGHLNFNASEVGGSRHC